MPGNRPYLVAELNLCCWTQSGFLNFILQNKLVVISPDVFDFNRAKIDKMVGLFSMSFSNLSIKFAKIIGLSAKNDQDLLPEVA